MQTGRVCAEHRASYRILCSGAELEARVSGRFMHAAASRESFPAVGDLVEFDFTQETAIIQAVLPRRSAIVRKAAGSAAREQVIAANVDYLFVVCALDGDFNARRIERYVALAKSGGVETVIVLNKADVCRDLEGKLEALHAAHIDLPIHVLSALEAGGIAPLRRYLREDVVVALAGSSGAGKSTIANALLENDRQTTSATRESDGRGRHATTSRSLFVLPGGALLVDTPGMRELHLWDADQGIDASFADVAQLAANCRFSDCRHRSEPECRIREALTDGTLDADRFENFQKLLREQAHLERQIDSWQARAEREKWKQLNRDGRAQGRFKRRMR